MKPATRQVLALLRLRGGYGLTPAEARSTLACDRLAPRIHELRKLGYDIETVREGSPMGGTFARYYLDETPAQVPTTGEQIGLALA